VCLVCTHAILLHRDEAGQLQQSQSHGVTQVICAMPAGRLRWRKPALQCGTLHCTCLKVTCVHFTAVALAAHHHHNQITQSSHSIITGCCYCVQDKSTDIIDAIARCVWCGCFQDPISLCSHVHAVPAHHFAGQERAVSAALPSARRAVCCGDPLLNICLLVFNSCLSEGLCCAAAAAAAAALLARCRLAYFYKVSCA
jgi:hypothetical protein